MGITKRAWLRAGILLSMTSLAGVAWASSGGITGKSGKQAGSCNGCHGGGITPAVKLEGPTSLDAGMTALYTFVIETDAAITGMNAAVSADDSTMAAVDGGATYEDGNEITHSRTVRPDAGVALYAFEVTAPPFGGTLTLYAAGNAANNSNDTDGDESAKAILEINVAGPERPPPPPPQDSGTSNPKPPTTTPTPDAAVGTPTGDAGPSKRATTQEDDSGCTIGWAAQHSDAAPTGAMLGGLIGVAAIARFRRRRR